MLEFLASSWVLLGVSTLHLGMRIGVGLACSTYTSNMSEGKSYKLIINGESCVNIISKTVVEKMGLKAEPHPQSYNVTWANKTAQSVT